jgi:type IV pilus assembly protein PilN
MIRINLLPHREEKRKERRQQFYVVVAAMLLIGVALVFLVHMVNVGHLESQDGRNQYFKAKIAELDKEIAEIKELRTQIDRLLARKQVIESLQSNRAETVHLFNELALRVPTGVFLTTIKQAADKITLKGVAQSNARVSLLMSSLNESPFLQNSEVVKSEASTINNRRIYQFEVNVYIERSVGTAGGETVANAVSAPRG